jgi:hypothetical protein
VKGDLAVRCVLGLVFVVLGASVAPANNETFKLVPSVGKGLDWAGQGVAVSGHVGLVGGPQAAGASPFSGTAFVVDASTGAPGTKLVASDGADFDYFGWSVAVQGTTAVVGAPYSFVNGVRTGSAYVFDTTTGTQIVKLVAGDGGSFDAFGRSVAIAGGIALVGAPLDDDQANNAGAVYVFDATTGAQLGKLVAADGALEDNMGEAVALDGTTVLGGAPNRDGAGLDSGCVYVFDLATGAQVDKIQAPDASTYARFGSSVDVEGSTMLVGSRSDSSLLGGAGSAYLFDLSTGLQTFKLVSPTPAVGDQFGTSVALDGGRAVVGAGTDPLFGGAGSAHVFDVTTGAHAVALAASDGAPGDRLGTSVAADCGLVLVGAPGDDDNGPDSGSTYGYVLSGTGPSTYCTAGTSSSGCQATLSSTGVPSGSAPSGFRLIATSVEGAKDGLFFFGTNGRQANPWGNGTSLQCVVPPVVRTPLLPGTGTNGSCNGVLSRDLNALWCPTCPNPAKNPGTGALVQAQLWYRDPFSTDNQTTAFSNALEFCLEP